MNADMNGAGKVIGVATLSVILALSSGCGTSGKGGGGTRSITAGTTTTTAVYGWGADDKLGFVIFTDLDTPDTVGSASSKWTGYIESPTAPTVHYGHTSDGMDINGTEYKFANGRVFLVSAKEGSISVRQLDIPIGDLVYDTEIDRIAKLEEIQEFLDRRTDTEIEDGGTVENADRDKAEAYFVALGKVQTAEEEEKLLTEFGEWLKKTGYKIRVEEKNGKHNLSCPYFPPVTPWTEHSFRDIKNLELLPRLEDDG